MKPIFERRSRSPRRIVYAEGEDERVLRAAQQVIDEKLAMPILVGRRETIRKRIEKLGLRMRLDNDVELRNPEDLPSYQRDWTLLSPLHGARAACRPMRRAPSCARATP